MKNIPFLLVFLFAYSSVAALFPTPLVRNPFTTNSGAKIVGAGSGITVSSNNAGTWTITGATTNYIATTNGRSRGLTNLGEAYSDRLVVTNLIIGTNTTSDSGRPPLLNILTVNGNIEAGRTLYVGTLSGGGTAAVYTYAGGGNVYLETSTDPSGYLPVGTLRFKRTDTEDLHAIRMGGFTFDPGKAIQFTKTNGFLYLTSGDSTYANSTNRFHIHQVNSRGVTVTNSSTENVSITNGVVNATKALIIGTNLSSVVASNGNIRVGGNITTTGSGDTGYYAASTYGNFRFGESGQAAILSWDSRSLGAINMYRSDLGRFSHLNWGHENQTTNIATLYTGYGSDMTLMNGGLNFSTSTNKLTVPRFQVSSNSFSAIITNIMTTNVVWDFPSTSVNAIADLGATITGVKDGDEVIVSPPQAAMTGIIGFYTGFASNGVAYARFVPTAATQDPASGTFRVVVTQYK